MFFLILLFAPILSFSEHLDCEARLVSQDILAPIIQSGGLIRLSAPDVETFTKLQDLVRRERGLVSEVVAPPGGEPHPYAYALSLRVRGRNFKGLMSRSELKAWAITVSPLLTPKALGEKLKGDLDQAILEIQKRHPHFQEDGGGLFRIKIATNAVGHLDPDVFEHRLALVSYLGSPEAERYFLRARSDFMDWAEKMPEDVQVLSQESGQFMHVKCQFKFLRFLVNYVSMGTFPIPIEKIEWAGGTFTF